jgi:hypothetical protein
VPASLFGNYGGQGFFSNLQDLQLTGTGFQSVQHLANLTSLTRLWLGQRMQRPTAVGMRSLDNRDFFARCDFQPGNYLPVGLSELRTMGISFDNIEHLTKLTSLRIQPQRDVSGGACAVLPVAPAMQCLDIVFCDGCPVGVSPMGAISCMTSLTSLAISIQLSRHELYKVLQHLPRLQCLSVQRGGCGLHPCRVRELLPVKKLSGCLQTLRLQQVGWLASSLYQLSSLTRLTQLWLWDFVAGIDAAAFLHYITAVPSLVQVTAIRLSGNDVAGEVGSFIDTIKDDHTMLPHLKALTLPGIFSFGSSEVARLQDLCATRGLVFSSYDPSMA